MLRRSVGGAVMGRFGAAARLRRVALASACILVAGAGRGTLAKGDEAPARRYLNPEYEFAVALPRGVRIETSRAPAPNHGFDVRLPSSVHAWVFAYYPDEVSTLSQAVAYEAEVRLTGCALTERKSATLGGIPAVELTLRCPSRPGHAESTTERVILTLQRPPDRGLISYEVAVQYPTASRNRDDAERVFRALADGFSFTGQR